MFAARQLAVRLTVSICIVCSISVVHAQKSWPKFASFRRVEADPQKTYEITEASGPWMILAASFAGDGAESDAHELVVELRRRFKWNAYTNKRHYDYTQPVVGRGVDEYGDPKKMRYRQCGAFDEIGVLIGDFPSVDDPQLQTTLRAVKYCRPTCLQLGNQKTTTLRFAGLRAFHKRINGEESKRRKGPLGQAFVTRNPLLPQEYFTPGGFDSLVESINRDVKYSLLDCKGDYSVRVATFRGNVVIDPKQVETIEKTGRMESRLTQAAERAHRLTEMLRKRGVEAYEFHDRHESIVTVGSFPSVGTPRRDGKIEIDARILKVVQNYGARQKPLPGGGKSGVMPRTLGGITFDIQPVPVEVPRRSIAADYARRGTVR